MNGREFNKPAIQKNRDAIAGVILTLNDLTGRVEALELEMMKLINDEKPLKPMDMTHFKVGELYECYRNGEDKILTPYKREECFECGYVWNPNQGPIRYT